MLNEKCRVSLEKGKEPSSLRIVASSKLQLSSVLFAFLHALKYCVPFYSLSLSLHMCVCPDPSLATGHCPEKWNTLEPSQAKEERKSKSLPLWVSALKSKLLFETLPAEVHSNESSLVYCTLCVIIVFGVCSLNWDHYWICAYRHLIYKSQIVFRGR